MTRKELVDKISSNLFKENGRLESFRSWRVIRNYLEELDDQELIDFLKENQFDNQ